MQLTKTILPLMPLLRGLGLNRRVKGWNRSLFALFPLAHQSTAFIEISYRGQPYLAAPQHYVDWQVLTAGAYEIDDLVVFERLAHHIPHATVLDIGTNVGHHAFVFATLGWDVLAFEPNPELWAIVEAKVNAAKLPNIHLNKFGLGDTDEVLVFSIPDLSNSGTGQFHKVGSALPEGSLRLPIRQGDSCLAQLGIEKIDVVKIDVQGFESQVLNGLRATLERDRPILCVEVGAENRQAIPTLAALAALLPVNYDFRCVRFDDLVVMRRAHLTALDPSAFPSFEGNVFCMPAEHAPWLDTS